MNSDHVPPPGDADSPEQEGTPCGDSFLDAEGAFRDDDAPVEDVLSDEDAANAQPHCPHCLEPITLEQYYCGKCGQSVGQLTAALPLINVPFEANFIGKAWRVMWADGTGFGRRLQCGLVVLAGAPFLFLALPIVIWAHFAGPRDAKPAGAG